MRFRFIVAHAYGGVAVEKPQAAHFQNGGGVFVLIEVYAEVVAAKRVYKLAAVVKARKKAVSSYIRRYA